MKDHNIPGQRSGLIGEQMCDQSQLLIDIGRVALCPDVPFLVIHVDVPREEHAGQELLHFDADVHGDGDDVVVQHQPDQRHVEAFQRGTFYGFAKVPKNSNHN